MGHRRHILAPRGWDISFDEASASTITEDAGSVRVAPRLDWNGNWSWHAMRSRALAGSTPHFLIAKANRYGAPAAGENLAVWSQAIDTDTWYKFDNQSIGASDVEFYNNAPFPNGPIYISYLPLYPFSRVGRMVREWLKDARVTVVTVGQATPRASAGGRRAPGLPFYMLKFTNANANTKNNMFVTCYNHPSETTGPYQLEGAMAWLLAGSVEAEFLLDWFNVYICPCLNPQGVVGGYFRSCPQNATLDHNREWDSTGSLECIDAFKTAMSAETSDAAEVGIDFHSSLGAIDGYMSSDDHTAALYAAWLAKMQAIDAGFSYDDAAIADSLRTLWTGSYSAKLGVSCEYGAVNTKALSDWKTQGQSALKSIASMHADGRWTNGPGVGSRDFNGSTDRIDWASIANLTASALTISVWAYLDGTTGDKYLFHIGVAAETAGLQFAILNATIGAGAWSFTRKATTNLWHASAAGVLGTGAWIHLLVTHDGVITTAASAHMYKNGVEISYGTTQNGATETTISGTWSMGGRLLDDLRNFDGKEAQLAVWNRVLTAGEIANLAAGYAADLAAPTSLLLYLKANTSSLVAVPGGTGTADGTTQLTGVGNGPSIIYG